MVNISLTTRMVLWVTFGVISIFTVVNTYDYLFTKELLNKQLRQLAEFEVLSSERTVSEALDSLQDQANITAALIKEVPLSKKKLESMVKTALQQNEQAYGMSIVVKGEEESKFYASYFYRLGREIRFVDLAKDDYSIRSKDWYQQALTLEDPSWTEPYFDKGAGEVLMITYLAPFRHNGDFILITIDLAVSEIQSLLASMEDKQDMSIYAITPNGHIISGHDEEMMLQQLYGVEVELKKRSDGFVKMLDEIKSKESGSFSTFCIRMQEECWISYAPLGDTQWTLLVSYSHANLFNQLKAYGEERIKQISLGIVLLILVIWLVTRRQFIPLKALDEATQEFAKGKLDFKLPVSARQDEIGSLTQSFSKMQISLNNYIGELKRETQKRERINSDLRTASKIQQSLLPTAQELNNEHLGVHLSAYLKPARAVGGDFYYYNLQEDEKKLCFVIGDVSDKGVAAAIFMARVVTAIRTIIDQTKNPAKVLTQLNKQLVEDNEACMFVTVLVGTLNIETGELLLASAGHPMPFCLRSNMSLESIEQLNGPALGFYLYDFECVSMSLEEDTSIFAYTDGLDEAVDISNELYGEDRILKNIQTSVSSKPSDLISNTLASLNEFVGQAEPADDLTLLAIHWKGMNKTHKKVINISNNKKDLKMVNQALNDYLCEYQLPESLLMNLELIAEEVMVNIINYGYAESDQSISLLIDHDDLFLTMIFVDRAMAFNPLEQESADLGIPEGDEPVGGLGIHLVKEISDKCSYEHISGENRLTVSCYLTK